MRTITSSSRPMASPLLPSTGRSTIDVRNSIHTPPVGPRPEGHHTPGGGLERYRYGHGFFRSSPAPLGPPLRRRRRCFRRGSGRGSERGRGGTAAGDRGAEPPARGAAGERLDDPPPAGPEPGHPPAGGGHGGVIRVPRMGRG